MNIYIPYFYIIGWSELDRWYVGCRIAIKKQIANPSDLMTTYFTSSKYVHEIIQQHGMPDVKWTFPCVSADEALRNERRIMSEFHNFLSDDRWLNKNTGGAIIQDEAVRTKISLAKKGKASSGFGKGSKHTITAKAKMGNKGHKSDEHKLKISAAMKGKSKSTQHIEKVKDRYRTFFYNGQYMTKTELAAATGLTTHQIEYRKKMGQDIVPPHRTV